MAWENKYVSMEREREVLKEAIEIILTFERV